MSAEVISAVVSEVGRLSHSQAHPVSVVLHGGEPLLLGVKGIKELVGGLRGSLRQDAGIHVQTNGVLLSEPFIEVFAEHDVGISISFDGPVHDRNRLDLAGRGSHDRVLSAIERLNAHPAGGKLFTGLLAVVDPDTDPTVVYEALKATGAPGLDFLYRDGNHVTLPYGKLNSNSTECGEWMIRLADHYLADPDPPRIRVLDDLIRLILGGKGRKEGIGLTEYGIIVIETDGTVTKNDTLKVGHAGGDRFSEQHRITDRRLEEFLHADEMAAYHGIQRPSSPVCQKCPELQVCGGGMTAHRWSDNNGYDNPSIFCADQKLLIGHLRGVLATVISRCGENAGPATVIRDQDNVTEAERARV
jgi:uncharacterized protein